MDKKIKRILYIMTSILTLVGFIGCGKSTSVEALQDDNKIPENGIITAEQFKTIAGEDKAVTFYEEDNGIMYEWQIDAALIRNPQEQNYKIKLTYNEDDALKEEANNASKVLQVNFSMEELICKASLRMVIPEVWDVDGAVLVTRQDEQLVKMADCNVEVTEATTIITMELAHLENQCFIVAGKGQQGKDQGKEVEESKDDENKNVISAGQDEKGTDPKNKEKKKCKISINCSTILENMDDLAEGKSEFVPSNGWILKSTEVAIKEGDTVFDILKRVCRDKGIHMEASNSPTYGTSYVEGINQLYEMDCGELSGWMFKVNGWSPNYGAGRYKVQDGDEISWVYTCNLGEDVGN